MKIFCNPHENSLGKARFLSGTFDLFATTAFFLRVFIVFIIFDPSL
jgi:hypothetical protein